MKEILRANDPALLSFVEALLTEAGVAYFVADGHMSVVEGSIGAFQRRILVTADDEREARALLAAADLGGELRPKK
jgi:uncharacterized protein (DUF1330 family)